ncbi:DUF2798 domain-containing protein [Variovorax dokdonensis]|uniref:DUF2798 domain-containing protein n=1 Tax=Variovorax dokdonensis TaxID=344883 RepID=A0ABT7N8I2_9BURK|nr:DUF2798 domain-containing protein [Variovorax dokdonensis]MDM0044249.1 DUF2798 domain-containing protein [Variovorax dokdonensis]
MIPKKYAPMLFGFILSGLMSLLVSGVSTYRVIGAAENFLPTWGTSWATAWSIAFPVVLVVAPLARRLVDLLVRDTREVH